MVLFSKGTHKNIVARIKARGSEINGTYELTGCGLITHSATTRTIIDELGLDESVIEDFVYHVTNFKEAQIGPYDTSKYLMAVPDARAATNHIEHDCLESRRCVVMFPPEHCFQSIQFLIREGRVDVVCFMRSCDAIKNLPYDVWLCSWLADIFLYNLGKTGAILSDKHKITMSFGSLHVYKEDLGGSDVL